MTTLEAPHLKHAQAGTMYAIRKADGTFHTIEYCPSRADEDNGGTVEVVALFTRKADAALVMGGDELEDAEIIPWASAPMTQGEEDDEQDAGLAALYCDAIADAPSGDFPDQSLRGYEQVIGLLLSIPTGLLWMRVHPASSAKIRDARNVFVHDGGLHPDRLNSRQRQTLFELEDAGYVAVKPFDEREAYIYVTAAGVKAFADHMLSGNALEPSVILEGSADA